MKGDWEGIPGEWITDDTAIDGHRFVAAPYAIRQMRQRMQVRAKNKCEFCNDWAYHGERHHVYGRGIGGGKKEDRPTVLGVRFVLWTCRACHEQQTIKPWGCWPVQPAFGRGRSMNVRGKPRCSTLEISQSG